MGVALQELGCKWTHSLLASLLAQFNDMKDES